MPRSWRDSGSLQLISAVLRQEAQSAFDLRVIKEEMLRCFRWHEEMIAPDDCRIASAAWLFLVSLKEQLGTATGKLTVSGCLAILGMWLTVAFLILMFLHRQHLQAALKKRMERDEVT